MAKTRSTGFEEENTDDTPVRNGKKYLLGIGIDHYDHWTPLDNAVRDMNDIVEVLTTRYDFDRSRTIILSNENATRDRIEEELFRFTEDSAIGATDFLLVYYSGHGHLDLNKTGYWVPVNANKGRIASYLPNSRIRELISFIKCRHVLLISDSCYSGALFARTRGGDADELVAAEYEKRISRWAVCSGRDDEKVSDGNDGNSPFAKALLQELKLNTSGKMHVSRLAERVTAITRNNYRQFPDFGPIQDTGDMGGQFVFTLKNYVEDLVTAPDPIPAAVTTRGGYSEPTTTPTAPISDAKEAILRIQDYIGAGKTEEAIKILMNLSGHQYSDIRNTAILLSGRYKSLKREEMMGTADSRDANLERNKINASILNLINDL